MYVWMCVIVIHMYVRLMDRLIVYLGIVWYFNGTKYYILFFWKYDIFFFIKIINS